MPIVIRHDQDLVGRIPGLAERAGKGTRLQREAALDIAYRQDARAADQQARAAEQQAFAQQQTLDAAQLQRDVAMVNIDRDIQKTAATERNRMMDRRFNLMKEEQDAKEFMARLDMDKQAMDQRLEISQNQINATNQRLLVGEAGRDKRAEEAIESKEGLALTNMLMEQNKSQKENQKKMLEARQNRTAKSTAMANLHQSGDSALLNRMQAAFQDPNTNLGQFNDIMAKTRSQMEKTGEILGSLNQTVVRLSRQKGPDNKLSYDIPSNREKEGVEGYMTKDMHAEIEAAVLADNPQLRNYPDNLEKAVQIVAGNLGYSTNANDPSAPPHRDANLNSPKYEHQLRAITFEYREAYMREKGLSEMTKEQEAIVHKLIEDYARSKGWTVAGQTGRDNLMESSRNVSQYRANLAREAQQQITQGLAAEEARRTYRGTPMMVGTF